ncbi:uncharacterized protein LOC121727091, partial [Aricia agestis]|uniref:uncharacterized protein LOC121727091 n=1 Tax=Aricia agestis TaxID=91739 RepID=UPI001C204CB8
MDIDTVNNIKYLVNLCLLPKLNKDYEESDNHPEIVVRNKSLELNVDNLEKALESVDLCNENAGPIIAHLLILYLELNSTSAWNDDICNKVSKRINLIFLNYFNLSLHSILYKDGIYNSQEIFNICIEELHMKLTYDNFKKYPGQIEVYSTLIKDIKKYQITMRPSCVMPLSLLLMDDYVNINKQNGLECCLRILECLDINSFEGGNYYEVIHRTLKKLLYDKEIKITQLTHCCLLELCKLFPCDEKDKKFDDLYCVLIEQLTMESNLYRKSECLRFLKSLISMHKTNCISRSGIKVAMCDCLDICTEYSVAEILLHSTLQCLKEWIKYCWCVWKFPKDHKMMSVLLKLLYTCKNEELIKVIQDIFLTLYSLCSNIEQEQILCEIQKNLNSLPEDYCKKLTEI